MFGKIILILAIIIVIGGLSFIIVKSISKQSPAGQRQAVFLTNGQVYFGELSALNQKYVELRDVYYLKGEDLKKLSETTEGKQKLLLVKMGNELHQPENLMRISADQVLFYQDLKSSSRINDAIAKFVADQIAPSETLPDSVTK